MNQQQTLIRLILVFLCLISSATVFAKPTASVDRSQIGLDETLTLTLRINESSFFSGPDLTPLEKDFEILAHNQSSRHSIVNGQAESFTEWIIRMAPKRTGKIIIPPIEIGGEKSDPLSIEVSQSSPTTTNQAGQIFVEAQFDQQQAYVQAQLIFTLRLFSSVNLVDLKLEAPQIDDAIVEKLSDTSYEKTINGQRYGVYEIKYAIFPQSSGKLTIPPVLFAGNIAQQRRNRSFFDPFNNRGQNVRRRSPEASIVIKEKPSGYPAGQVWLPSKNLQLIENWSKDPGQLEVGESVTRTVQIIANGMLSEQLPPIAVDTVEGIKTYPDQAQNENRVSPTGVTGIRSESTAILPTKAGKFLLPALSISWWDTTTHQLKVATLPAKSINVTGAAAPLIQPPLTTPTITQPASDIAADRPLSASGSDSSSSDWLSNILAVFFACAWLVTLVLYWRLREKLKQSVMRKSEPDWQKASTDNEKTAFRALDRACKNNDPAQIRQALIQWANSFWPNSNIRSLEDIGQTANNDELRLLLQDLDRSLYGSHDNSTGSSVKTDKQSSSEALLALISQIRKLPGKGAKTQNRILDPLYPISS
jgi:hypothetical protein